jgi:hypothetical protein
MTNNVMDNVIEPCPIDDVFCTELVKVTRVGPCLRLVFTTPQAEHDNSQIRVIVARLIIPAEEAATVARTILEGPPQDAKPSQPPKLHTVN